MVQKRTLTVSDATFGKFNALKIRVAIDSNNRVPGVSTLVSALIAIGNAHYPELIIALSNSEDSE